MEKEVLFQVGVVYVASKMFYKLAQVYTPLYIQETIPLSSTSVATFPLVIYGVGFASSIVMTPMNRKIGPKLTYCIGSGLGKEIE